MVIVGRFYVAKIATKYEFVFVTSKRENDNGFDTCRVKILRNGSSKILPTKCFSKEIPLSESETMAVVYHVPLSRLKKCSLLHIDYI